MTLIVTRCWGEGVPERSMEPPDMDWWEWQYQERLREGDEKCDRERDEEVLKDE